jgi:hypothetical protein
MTIERCNPYYTGYGLGEAVMKKDDNGRWVKHEDFEKEIEVANAEIERLVKECDSLKKTVMHNVREKAKTNKEISELNCPSSYGFEGAGTFSDCGCCVVCRSKKEMGIR